MVFFDLPSSISDEWWKYGGRGEPASSLLCEEPYQDARQVGGPVDLCTPVRTRGNTPTTLPTSRYLSIINSETYMNFFCVICVKYIYLKDQKAYLQRHVPQELCLLEVAKENVEQAAKYIENAYNEFANKWSELHPLALGALSNMLFLCAY